MRFEVAEEDAVVLWCGQTSMKANSGMTKSCCAQFAFDAGLPTAQQNPCPFHHPQAA